MTRAELASSTVPRTWTTVPTQALEAGGVRFAYRELGPRGGVPVLFLTHLAAFLDNWDPRVVDGVAAHRHVITFDNRGVGASSGTTSTTISEMAADAVRFVRAVGHDKVDLFGFSMGGMVAQVIAQTDPAFVRRMVIAGTGPAGGVGIDQVTRITYWDMLRGLLTFQDPKVFLFFTRTPNGRQRAAEFIARLGERTQDRDRSVRISTLRHQLTAIHRWGTDAPQDLSNVTTPTLVVNGESDRMVPTVNTLDLGRRIPNSRVVVYEDAGHGGVFQCDEQFVPTMLAFLAEADPAGSDLT